MNEYTEYHENVLQSYRHKQLNTQLLEYTEVPGEAIWWHRMQQKLSAAGAPSGPRWGSLQRSPMPPTWWGGRLAANLQLPPALGPLDLASPVPPLQNCAPLDSGWRRP